MAKSSQPLPTDAELDILSALWRLGPATVREIHEALARKSTYTTTLKQLQIMLDKRLVARSERFRSHVYEAARPKEQTRQAVIADLLKRAFDGSAKALVMGALSAKPASAEELSEIRRLIDSFEQKRGESK